MLLELAPVLAFITIVIIIAIYLFMQGKYGSSLVLVLILLTEYIYNYDSILITGGSENKMRVFSLEQAEKKHVIDRDKYMDLDLYARRLFDTAQPDDVSHLKPDAEIRAVFSPTVDINGPSNKFKMRATEYRKTVFCEPLRRLLSSIQFFTLACIDHKPGSALRVIYVVEYLDEDFKYLVKMFPSVHIDVYCQYKSATFINFKQTDKVTIHPDPFSVNDASANYGTDYVALFYDLRALGNFKYADNMSIQAEYNNYKNANDYYANARIAQEMRYYNILNPDVAFLKLSLSWKEGNTEMPSGDIYVQPYNIQTDYDTFLYAKKGNVSIKYNHSKYSNYMFTFNTTDRLAAYKNIISSKFTQPLQIDSCYDCTLFVHIISEYVKHIKGSSPNKNNVGRIIKDIQSVTKKCRDSLWNYTVMSQTMNLTNLYTLIVRSCGDYSCKICTKYKY